METERSTMRMYGVMISCVLVLSMAMQQGCASSQRRDGNTTTGVRNQQLAAELTNKAVDLLFDDPIEAERVLRQALQADLYYGPAHNNLGVLHLNRGELYEAAEEFDWARRLMPGHPDPRINLGLALERGGKIEDALDAYASAIEVYPNHLPATQALARCQIRHGHRDEWTDELLETIIYRGSAEWKSWAKNQIKQDD